VKSRNWDDERDIVIDKINWYKEYWGGSILTVIIPHGHWFYAQYVDKLEVNETLKSYNLRVDFEKFENIFTKVKTDTLYRFKSSIAEKMGRPKDHAHYFPEKEEFHEIFFFPTVLRIIENNKGKTIDQLFDAFNRDYLVSRKLFHDSLEKLVQMGKINKIKDKFYLQK
jgi:hypothetical protein